MSLSSKIARNLRAYGAILRQDGPSQAGYNLAHEIINKVAPFSIYRVMLLATPDIPPRYFELPEPFTARFLTPEEALRHAEDPDNDIDAPFVRRALEDGEACFGIFDGRSLCSYSWYSDRPCHTRRELYFYFPGGFKYQHKGFTYPRYRGRRLHGHGKALACRHYTDLGYRGLLSVVEAHNVNSLRSNYRLGETDAGKIAVILWQGRYRTFADAPSRSLGCALKRPAGA